MGCTLRTEEWSYAFLEENYTDGKAKQIAVTNGLNFRPNVKFDLQNKEQKEKWMWHTHGWRSCHCCRWYVTKCRDWQGLDPSSAAHCWGPSILAFASTECHLHISTFKISIHIFQKRIHLKNIHLYDWWHRKYVYTFSVAAHKSCKSKKKANEECCCKLSRHCCKPEMRCIWYTEMLREGRLLYTIVLRNQGMVFWPKALKLSWSGLAFLLHWPDVLLFWRMTCQIIPGVDLSYWVSDQGNFSL